MLPSISVVIPYYNRAHTIARAIDSVLGQTLQDFEIIVVDDASSDDLHAALAPYALDQRLTVIRKSINQGPGAARNTGTAAAAGRFVAFLDSDDIWLPNKLRQQLDAVLGTPDPDNVLCVTKTEILLDAGRRIVRPVRAMPPGGNFAEYLYSDGGFAQTSSFFLACNLAKRFPFCEDLRQLEDHLFFIEVGASGATFLLVEDVLTIWHNETAADRASSADDLDKWVSIVARFSERAAPFVSPKVLLAGEVRFLSGRLWANAPLKSLQLLSRAFLTGALSPTQTAAVFVRNVLPLDLYNRARHWLAARRPAEQNRLRPADAGIHGGASGAVELDERSIIFVTEELFLPPRNGSQQTYDAVAKKYAAEGWKVFCISFYRDPKVAFSSKVTEAYKAAFCDYLLLPGWNRGGTVLGKIGQLLREADRSLTGNVLSSHPFLVTKSKKEVERIVAIVKGWNAGTLYVHKVHCVQLLANVLDAFEDTPTILNMHDDFVLRAKNYDSVHKHLFGVLPLRLILRSHAAAWIRHNLSRTNQTHSRNIERKLLQRCDKILVCSAQEMATYLTDPALADRLLFEPLAYDVADVDVCSENEVSFDAGFIGSEDVMNIDALLYFRDEILPKIKAAYPEFRLLVAGRVGPVARPLLNDVEGITIWDSFDRLEDFYRAFKLAIIPMRYGTGMSIRFLEALKYSKPVVSTTIGIRGLASERPQNVVVADDPDLFASSVVALSRPTRTARTERQQDVAVG